MKRQVS